MGGSAEFSDDANVDMTNDNGGDIKSDSGGDLASDDGVDLNATNVDYPANDGFVEGTEENITLKPGDAFDRYGHSQAQGGEYEGDVAEFIENDDPYADLDSPKNDLGYYAAPEGTPYGERSLEGGSQDRNLYTFEANNPIDTKSGVAAPYYGQEGGGMQYQFPESIDTMMENGDVKPTSVSFEIDNRGQEQSTEQQVNTDSDDNINNEKPS